MEAGPSTKPPSVNKLACTSCRTRKVRCLEGDGERCSQCCKHDLVCRYEAHKRGRPLGSKTKAAKVKQLPPRTPQEPSLPLEPNHELQPELGAPLALFGGSASAEQGQGTTGDRLYRYQPQSIFAPRYDNGLLLDPLTSGVCSVEEAKHLFNFFFAHLHSYGGFLDAELHGDVEFIRARSSLLLTAVLMISARHDHSPSSQAIAERADAHISKVCWPAVLLENYRSVQALQACMLLATWRASGSRGDEDSGWALFGHALRMAVEIGLQRPLRKLHDESNEAGERLVRDAQRAWSTLALADASWSAQTGRPPLLPLEQQPPEWLQSQITTPEDRSIVALIEYRRILKSLRSQNADALELPAKELLDWQEKWYRPGNGARMSELGNIYSSYGQLLLLGARLSSGYGVASVAFKEAASLIDAAAVLPTEVLHHAHDNFYTMLMYSIQIVFHLRDKSIDPSAITHTITTLHALQPLMSSAGSTPPHKDGLAHLYAARLAKLLNAWEVERSGGEVGDLLTVQPSNAVQQTGYDDLMTMGSDFLSLDSTYLSFFEQQPDVLGFDGNWMPTMQW
ncbi:hypothetical protein BCR35DRAFT_351006 [Leucosporidium creatinivorum]|uniref:Zn(2)-C6 fungal-type domain-containing protein n=1 Tax=Leucosporidium creatinivorum TaxID=106004 RepID=A0A1Y2FWV6_9BASI|nr:hypothetical protein BCR35DRAFT_351006 [Leucosporidium creatinivorum]